MTTQLFSREELSAAFETFERTVAHAAETRDWDAWAEQYTPDVEYVEHAAGTMRCRDEVRAWIRKTMTTFPGSHMTAFPSLWSVIDESTGRIICELDNPMVDPGDGTAISATNISIITYAGDNQWCRQEDIYNPLRFVRAAMKWCKKAQQLGTLDDDAALDAAVRRPESEAEMKRAAKLVVGANGFLGSHVTRQLVAAGAEVWVMVRPTANTRSIEDLEVTRFHGDVFDTATLRAAMDGCDDVHYCVVDTRAWLRDPSPLFRTNVEGLRNVLEVAKQANLRRFVFTSTYATVGRRRGRVATEDDRIVRRRLTPYVQSRVQAEDLVLCSAKQDGLPAVAMCVSTTYGSGDWGRTPHGAFIAGAVFGKLPFMMKSIQLEVVGVDDAARALILAAEHGRNGERYLVSERMIPLQEVVRIAADEAGVPPPRRSISLPALYGLGALGLKARFTGKDAELSLASVRMMRAEAEVDHSKAVRELGWRPRPVEESIREAARFWADLRNARGKSATPG